MRVLGLTCRSPGWGDIVTASFVGMVLVVLVTAIESAGAIDPQTARDVTLGGITAVALRAYGIDLLRTGWRGFVVFMALVLIVNGAYATVAAFLSG